MSQIPFAVMGFGRMGQSIVKHAIDFPHLRLTAVLDLASSPHLGKRVGDVLHDVNSDAPIEFSINAIPKETKVIIDFSSPSGTEASLAYCEQTGCALVSGTTGIKDAQRERMLTQNLGFPLLYAGNMSLGVNLLLQVAKDVSSRLPEPFQVEIVEKHHTGKVDSPSGTALAMAEAVAEGRGLDPEQHIIHGRPREQRLRNSKEITVHALRLGTIPGEHSIHFAFGPEEITINHRAGDRSIFARGALNAAAFLAKQTEPGPYSMRDVLGL